MKKVAALFLCALIAFSLIGCSSSQNVTATSEKNDVSETSKVSLNFYYWDADQTEAMDKVISMFEAEHPDIEIVSTVIPSGDYWTKLQTSLPTGTGPDVFWMNMTAPDYYNNGLLYDMSANIAADQVDMSVFPSTLVDLYSSDSAVYGIPKDYDGIGLYYNKTIFDEMGIAYPTDQMTWSELLDLAEKTTTENHYGFAVQNAGNVCYQDFIYSNGGKIVSDDGMSCVINQPESVEAIQFLHDMMYVQKVSPTYAEQVETSANDMFISGKVAMISGGSWKIKPFSEALGDKLGICEMPVSKTPAITVHGLAYCISSKSEHIDASWQFVKFLATKEAQEATASGAIPAYTGCDQLWADNYAQYDAYKLLKGVNYTGSLGNPWWDNNYPDAKAILTDAMTTIWAEENIDIQAALDQCAADITAKTQN